MTAAATTTMAIDSRARDVAGSIAASHAHFRGHRPPACDGSATAISFLSGARRLPNPTKRFPSDGNTEAQRISNLVPIDPGLAVFGCGNLVRLPVLRHPINVPPLSAGGARLRLRQAHIS